MGRALAWALSWRAFPCPMRTLTNVRCWPFAALDVACIRANLIRSLATRPEHRSAGRHLRRTDGLRQRDEKPNLRFFSPSIVHGIEASDDRLKGIAIWSHQPYRGTRPESQLRGRGQTRCQETSTPGDLKRLFNHEYLQLTHCSLS